MIPGSSRWGAGNSGLSTSNHATRRSTRPFGLFHIYYTLPGRFSRARNYLPSLAYLLDTQPEVTAALTLKLKALLQQYITRMIENRIS